MNNCKHSMRKLGWRKGTQCTKCDVFLPRGLTWIPAPYDFMERGYTEGWETGVKAENERIIKLLKDIDHISDCCFQPNCCKTAGDLIALIKDETKNITSEILPDGTIYIEEVKGETK